MRYNVLKESFLPNFICDKENSKIYSKYNSPWGLKWGIEDDATHGLGYEPVRDRKEKVKTPQDLQNHLGKMDHRVMERKSNLYKATTFALIRYVNDMEKDINRFSSAFGNVKPKLNEILDYLIDNKENIEFLNYLKDEKVKQEEIPKQKVKKKGILERIFGN